MEDNKSPPINAQEVIPQKFSNSKELFEESIYIIYSITLSNDLHRLCKAMESPKWDDLWVYSCTLKSQAEYIGANKLAKHAKNLLNLAYKLTKPESRDYIDMDALNQQITQTYYELLIEAKKVKMYIADLMKLECDNTELDIYIKNALKKKYEGLQGTVSPIKNSVKLERNSVKCCSCGSCIIF